MKRQLMLQEELQQQEQQQRSEITFLAKVFAEDMGLVSRETPESGEGKPVNDTMPSEGQPW